MTRPRRNARGGGGLARPLLALVCLAGVAPCAAAGAQQRGRTRATMVRKPPKLDGRAADPLWKTAPVLHLHAAPGKEGKLDTRVRLLFGPKRLYVAVECDEPDAKLRAQARKRDGKVWADDCVELYVLPHPKVGYKQIAVNALGTVFDQAFGPGRPGDPGWNADVKAAVAARAGKAWTLELSVPYEDLGVRAGTGQTWRLNVTRVRKARRGGADEEYTWAVLPSANFHQPDAFGLVEHVDVAAPAGEPAARAAELRWTRLRTIRGVRRCFAHPLDPDVAWCATPAGLLATADGGNTWTPVKAATAQAVGEVTCLAVSTRDPRTLCIGTEARGLFLSTDGGGAFRRLGGEDERFAADHVEWVAFCPSDPSRRTLLATHGRAAPGMSVSRDLGRTWEVLGRDRFLKQFVKREQTVVAVGSTIAAEGKVWGIHRSGTDGLRWEQTLRSARPAACAAPPERWQFFVSTLDGRVLQSVNDGKSWSTLVRAEGSAWTSLFFTLGRAGRLLAAYDPHRRGLCLSEHRFAHGLARGHNRGLYVGPFVKSGASCTANANGTVFYVAMNNLLWIGRWTRASRGPAVVAARCVPCAVRLDDAAIGSTRQELHGHVAAIAAGRAPAGHLRSIAEAERALERAKARMRFVLRAEVRHPRGLRAVKRVTADLSKLGGRKATVLRDDGRHGDGKAGDGVYAAPVQLTAAVAGRDDFREKNLLTVTAADANGLSHAWPAVVHVSRGPRPLTLMRGGWDSDRTEGPVGVRMTRDKAWSSRDSVLCFAATARGAWRAAWLAPGDGVNSAGLKWLTFHIRGEVNQELFVHLVDHHKIGSEGFFDVPHFSKAAALVGDGYLKAITPGYQEVRVPIAKLLPKGVFFLRWHTAGIGLSAGKDAKAATYYVAAARIEP